MQSIFGLIYYVISMVSCHCVNPSSLHVLLASRGRAASRLTAEDQGTGLTDCQQA